MNDVTPVQNTTAGSMNPAEFQTFMRNYQDMVYTTAVRLVGNAAQAEDISQDVFLKAYENSGMLRQSATAGGWLKTVTRHLCLNHLQRYRKRWRFFSEFQRDDAGADVQPIEFAAPEVFFDSLDQEERRAWVARCVRELPEHQRVPLVLFHFEELSYEEIARSLGVSLAKVKTDILRGRAALARMFAQSGTAHETFSV